MLNFRRNFLKKIIDILIKARFTFFKPKNKKIVILDPAVSKPIEDLFFRLDYFYLYSRNEEINLFVLLKALINYKKNKNLSFNQVYILTYLNYLEPKIIINVTDYNIFFFKLKKIFSRSKTNTYTTSMVCSRYVSKNFKK